MFQLYLSGAGSYDAAKDSERDLLVKDENGVALSKDLPYGRYTVHQIEGQEGQAFVPDFTVFISSKMCIRDSAGAALQSPGQPHLR